MILTLEGAPAVGKSTIASLLAGDVIPEVNVLFGKSFGHSNDDWYLQRQLDRWQLATSASQGNRVVVLDGDVFQPLWFSALFWDEDWGDVERIAEFFRDAAAMQRVALPARYVCLGVTEDVRVQREVSRSMATGRTQEQAAAKASRYSSMALFLSDYFTALSAACPGLVEFVDTADAPDVVAAHIATRSPPPTFDTFAVIDFISSWSQAHQRREASDVPGAT